jgi:hypothetical protein
LANLRKILENDIKNADTTMNLELENNINIFETCLNGSVEASKVKYENALTKYTNCVDHAENVAKAAKLAVNLKKILTEAEKNWECNKLKYNIIGLQTALATIQENLNVDTTTQKQIIDLVISKLPDLEIMLLDCKYFENYMDVIEDAYMQQQELQSIVSDVSNAEYLGEFQYDITVVNYFFTNFLNSPYSHFKENTLNFISFGKSVISNIRSSVDLGKKNKPLTSPTHLSNYDTISKMIPNNINDIMNPYTEIRHFTVSFFKCTCILNSMTKVLDCLDKIILPNVIFNGVQMNSKLRSIIDEYKITMIEMVTPTITFRATACHKSNINKIFEKNVKLFEMIKEIQGEFITLLYTQCYYCVYKQSDSEVSTCIDKCILIFDEFYKTYSAISNNFFLDFSNSTDTSKNQYFQCMNPFHSYLPKLN